METPSQACLGRRDVLRLATLVPVVAAVSAACAPKPKEPDALLPLATAAATDAALAQAIARAHSGLAAAASEVATARNAHLEALRKEIERENPPRKDDPPTVPTPPPQQAPTSADASTAALRKALQSAQQAAAGLVPNLPSYRAGLAGSVSASCASLLEVVP